MTADGIVGRLIFQLADDFRSDQEVAMFGPLLSESR